VNTVLRNTIVLEVNVMAWNTIALEVNTVLENTINSRDSWVGIRYLETVGLRCDGWVGIR
jgi:hypothetical protein